MCQCVHGENGVVKGHFSQDFVQAGHIAHSEYNNNETNNVQPAVFECPDFDIIHSVNNGTDSSGESEHGKNDGVRLYDEALAVRAQLVP